MRASVLVSMILVGHFAVADQLACKDLKEDERALDLMKSLYTYSLIIEHAFDIDRGDTLSSELTCKSARNIGITREAIGALKVVPLYQDEASIKHLLVGKELLWVREDFYRGTVVYSPKEDDYVLSCNRDPTGPSLGFKIYRVYRRVTDVVSGDTTSVMWYDYVIVTHIISPGWFLQELNDRLKKAGKQSIQTQRLRRVHVHGSNDDKYDEDLEEEMFLIRGTQFGQLDSVLSEVLSSMNHIFSGSSCAYNLAAEVIKSGGIGVNLHKLVVAGHSLGGAVSQFIAKDRIMSKEQYKVEHFEAYSFSSIGLKDPPTHLSDLVSFHIDGDFFSGMGGEQAGTEFQYLPNRGFGGRHRLKQSQSALCLCMEGVGEAVVRIR